MVTLDEETGLGVMKTNPAARVRASALKEMRASWQSFGLDPASMEGIAAPEREKPESALDAILRSKSANDDTVN
jgi:hypothetical protein